MQPLLLILLALDLQELGFDPFAQFLQRFHRAALFLLHEHEVEGPVHLDDVADFSGLQTEENLLHLRAQIAVLHPAPVAALVLRRVLGIHPREVGEVRAAHDFLTDFLGHLALLRGLGAVVDLDHAKLHFVVRRPLLNVLVVVALDCARREHWLVLHLARTHGLDDDFVLLHLADAVEREALRGDGAHEGRLVPAEILADDRVHTVVNRVGRDLALHFFELLQDELAVNEVVQRADADLLDARGEFRAGVVRLERIFQRVREFEDLEKRDHVVIHHGGDGVEHPRLRSGRGGCAERDDGGEK